MNRTLLAACPSCSRHVRLSETACPFCHAELPREFRERAAPAPPARRLGRAALYALRMGAVSVTAAAACGGTVAATGSDGGEGDASALGDGSSGGASSGTASSGTAGSGTASSGMASTGQGSSGTSVDSGTDAPLAIAAYGGFIGIDAGFTGADAGSERDATSDRDAAPADAKADHPFIAPAYGLIPPGP